jgi:hypothetical protein
MWIEIVASRADGDNRIPAAMIMSRKTTDTQILVEIIPLTIV